MPPPQPSRRGSLPAGLDLSHHSAHGRPARRAFTLPELVLSLALIAFVAAFAISSFFSQSEITLHNALQLLADDMHEMQARATSLQIPVEIVFDPQGDGYHAQDCGSADPARARVFPLVTRRYSRDAVFEGVRIRRLQLKGADRIRFDAAGRSLTEGVIVVGYRDDARVLELHSERGFVCLPDSPRTRGWLDRLR
jgi:prepilin-type N-terminal cleavage/methylation domain-containing protein